MRSEKKRCQQSFCGAGGPLTFQLNDAITPARVAATWPNLKIAAGNIS